MHDTYGKENTAAALSSMIEQLRSEGIDMLPISSSTRPGHFEVNDDTPSDNPEDQLVTEGSTESDTSDEDTDGTEDSYDDTEGDTGESEGY